MYRRPVVSFFISPFLIPCSLIFVILLWPGEGWAKIRVEYDRGAKHKDRVYLPAEACVHSPCIITQWGAIRIPKGIATTHRVEIGAMHRGMFQSLALFQESTSLEQKLSERIFNRKPNRKIVNLERLAEQGKTEAIFLYGVLLQHELDEGDLLALQLTSLRNPSQVEEYFFRYHHDGAKFDLDMAFVQPINIFNPNPGGIVQAAYSTAALSFSVARAMDPEKHYSLPSKMVRAVRGNLFLGLLLRKDVQSFNGDNITAEFFDGFGGLGVTVFDFLAFGYGGNFIRSPHTTFPFVGLEVRHLTEFIRTLKADTHTRWQKYLKEEMAKPAVQGSSGSLRR